MLVKSWAEIVVHRKDCLRPDLREWKKPVLGFGFRMYLRILVYLVIYDSGYVSLEHLLLSWYPSQRLSFEIQGQNLALTVLYVPSSLDSGLEPPMDRIWKRIQPQYDLGVHRSVFGAYEGFAVERMWHTYDSQGQFLAERNLERKTDVSQTSVPLAWTWLV